MPLSVGDKLGHYEVLSLLGAGGMGEVYRARDTTLKRDVALKVLPATFLRDPERMARFQREAQVLASLDHPNIGHIYGIVDAEGSRGLVLALIEGPTLADRIEAGPLPEDEAIAIAKQIIEALEYAHDRGVVHRDLKPANIKITPEGAVKVLDFGLAKVLEDEPPPSSLTNSPTLTVGHTRTGVILGTAAYMSPEQAVGRAVDRRSDIFSFGAVLYEMLTGKCAFRGAATPDVLEAVVKNDPDWSALPAGTPPHVRRLLERMLVKDRKQRLQAIGEARIALESPGSQVPAVPVQTNKLAWAAATLLAFATGIALWAPWRAEPARPMVRLEVDLGADVALHPNAGTGSAVLSPDGTRLVYIARPLEAPAFRLYMRRLDQTKSVELPGTEGATRPFFSPDSQWIGFFAGGKINKISADGGAVVPLGDTDGAGSADWGQDGSILLSGNNDRGLRLIPPAGGQRVKVTDLANGEVSHGSPQILPGGKSALFTADMGPGLQNIEAVTLADGKRKVIVRGGAFPRYLPTGHLIYVNKSTLFAVPFDVDKLEARGNAVPILDDVRFVVSSGIPDLAFSRTGTLVYRRGGGDQAVLGSRSTIDWIDAGGKRSPLLAKAGLYTDPKLSPNGKLVALLIDAGTGLTAPGALRFDVWVHDPRRDALTKLTFGGAAAPVWSADGESLVFKSSDGSVSRIRADGAGQPQSLLDSQSQCVPSSLSPDGKRLACMKLSPGDGGRTILSQIFTVSVTEENGRWKAGMPEPFFESKFRNVSPTFSPDGKWLAYTTNESGRDEVSVRPVPSPASGQGGKWQISNNGGSDPRWSRNSRELLYRDQERLMVVSYTVNGNRFVAEKPRVPVEKLGGTQWDLAPDGRIVVLIPADARTTLVLDHSVVFLMNFSDELRRRVPTGK